MAVKRILKWTINSLNQERQEIKRSVDGLAYETIATLNATDVEYVDTQEVAYSESIDYVVDSIATIQGVEVRESSTPIRIAVADQTTFEPYQFISGNTLLNATAPKPFTISVAGGVDQPSTLNDVSGLYEVSDVPTPDGVVVSVIPYNNEYDFDITIPTGAKEIVSWSSYDWGVGQVSVKPALGPLVKVPTTAPKTTNLSYIFKGAAIFNDPSITNWNTDNVTDFSWLFAGCKLFNQPVTGWNTSKGTNLRGMFDRCFVFNQPVNHLNTAKNTDFGWMFNACLVFDQPLTNFDTSNGIAFDGMFRLNEAFNRPVNHFNTSKCTNFDDMFSGTKLFNQPIFNFDVSLGTSFESMFFGAEKFNQDISTWNVMNATNMVQMFYGAKVFAGNLSQWCVAKITSKPSEFDYTAGALTSPVWGTCPRGENQP